MEKIVKIGNIPIAELTPRTEVNEVVLHLTPLASSNESLPK
jgi:hypothetical protein